jgi:hypothetical protein
MTDANLMDADCIHGVTWWECDQCEQPAEPPPIAAEMAQYDEMRRTDDLRREEPT